jgi:serine phosphatase RsbU (regulator of sigma subunit)/HAMP domain-containing protein
MKWRFTISRRIALGFGLFILVVGIVFYLTSNTLEKSREINKRINEVYAPSLKLLEELDNDLVRSQQLMKHWAHIQIREDDRERVLAVEMCEKTIPDQLKIIRAYASQWGGDDTIRLTALENHIRNLMIAYAEIRSILPTFDSYSDPLNQMLAQDYFMDGGLITTETYAIRDKLDAIINEQRHSMHMEIERMNESFDKLRVYLVNIAIGIVIAGILIAYFTIRSIVKPVNSLKRKLANLSQGIYSVHLTKAGNDEIGDMANAVHRLISNFEKTKEFSLNVGSGNFNVPFAPLSEHDELGKALIRMRDDLASYRNEMEEKVATQTLEIRQQKDEVEIQRNRITEIYQDLQSSIDYAQRLQETILPNDQLVRDMFPDSFVYFKPKATVSGDFYWFKQKGEKKMFAAADCTGHGVPGAFMSLVGHNVLNQASKVYNQPASILNTANRLASEIMRSNDGEHFMKDGMDIALCVLDTHAMKIEFSGAHNPVYIIRNGKLTEIEADPFSIGTYVNGEKEFSNRDFHIEKGDCIYLFSDGYADQFGGPRGKKFMRRQFRELLLSISSLSMEEQKLRIAEAQEAWRGGLEQIDDILVIGVRV